MMVHNVDTARFVTGREPVRVAAMGPVPDAETVTDRVMATIELAGGVLLQTFDGWFVPGNRGSLEIHGSEGTAIALAAVGRGAGNSDDAGPLRQRQPRCRCPTWRTCTRW